MSAIHADRDDRRTSRRTPRSRRAHAGGDRLSVRGREPIFPARDFPGRRGLAFRRGSRLGRHGRRPARGREPRLPPRHRRAGRHCALAVGAGRQDHHLSPLGRSSDRPPRPLSSRARPTALDCVGGASRRRLPRGWIGRPRRQPRRPLPVSHRRRGPAHCRGLRHLASDWLGQARVRSDLGQDFGGGLSAAEVDHCMDREWACTADDMLWRRTKLGLRIGDDRPAAVRDYMAARCAPTMAKGARA